MLYELAERADVFLTSYLPDLRARLAIDVDDIRAINPSVIYARADAVGPRGPEAGKPGYDSAVFFGRGGILDSLTGDHERLGIPRPSFGDKTASMNLAFGVASALFHRERTGEPSEVDVSLLRDGDVVGVERHRVLGGQRRELPAQGASGHEPARLHVPHR